MVGRSITPGGIGLIDDAEPGAASSAHGSLLSSLSIVLDPR